ncbi:FtsB family cell division protein [Quadrisphaera granulorum]|uniref:FtsB family cell division protein n=1 Tax=Quadrisphaera granulorum TaxID=317664 RepID=UPI001474FA6C|nr:septum formation initiator family protein [Quadrisphaera granulorum]
MSSRPAPAARPRTTDPNSGDRRRGLTTRGAALLAVGLVAAASLLGPVRAWVEQRAELAALHEDIAAREQRVAELTAESARWDDPAYAATQARARFGYLMPGETGYTVLGAPASTTPSTAVAAPTATATPSPASLLDRVRSGLGLEEQPASTPSVTPAQIAPSTGSAAPATPVPSATPEAS